MTEQLNKVNFDKAVDKEKYEIKLQSLQKELKEMQNAHMVNFGLIADLTPKLCQSHLSKLTINEDIIRANIDKETQKRDRRAEDEFRLN